MKKNESCSNIDKVNIYCKKHRIECNLDASFTKLTTIGCGGKIALCVIPNSPKKLLKIVKYIESIECKYVIIGKGSNVLADDSFYDGVVILTRKLNRIKRKKNTVICQCGTNTVVLANQLAMYNLSGGEFLYCLPATIGGAVVSNAGCFGQEMSQIVKSVLVLYKGKKLRISAQNCEFSYRSSIFREKNCCILEVVLSLTLDKTTSILCKMQSNLETKRKKQPLKAKTMGCVFYNSDKTASLLIDNAKLKGVSVGGAKVSKKHCGFIENYNNATSDDVVNLINIIKNTVEKRGGQLNLEVSLVGDFNNNNDTWRLSHTHQGK